MAEEMWFDFLSPKCPDQIWGAPILLFSVLGAFSLSSAWWVEVAT